MQLQRHLKTLVGDRGLSVAIAEEMPRDDADKIRRQVIRVVTPGTLTEEDWLDRSAANYLLAVKPLSSDLSRPASLDLSWYDAATGDLQAQSSTMASLASDMARIDPREIILPEQAPDALRSATAALRVPISTVESSPDTGQASSIGLLGAFLARTVFRVPTLDAPDQLTASSTLQLDSDSLAALELRQSLRGSARGSVFSSIRRTVTPSGGRALLNRLCYPSTNIDLISRQHDLVGALVDMPRLVDDLVATLRRTGDTARLLQRFALGRSQPSSLLAVAELCELVGSVRRLLQDAAPSSAVHVRALRTLADRLPELADLGTAILGTMDINLAAASVVDDDLSALESAVDGDASAEADDASEPKEATATLNLFAPRPLRVQLTSSADLARAVEAHAAVLARGQDLEHRLHALAAAQRASLHESSPSHGSSAGKKPRITLRAGTGQGPYVHVAGAVPRELIARGATTISTTKTTHKLAWTEWISLYGDMAQQSSVVAAAEATVMRELDAKARSVMTNMGSLRRAAHTLDDLDIALSFARLALDMQHVRPIVDASRDLDIRDGRHVSVEIGMLDASRSYVPNSIRMDDTTSRVHVITGPNMGGKSTLLRQAALIVLVAQAGGFVPASYARIGVVDAIYTRIGARDDLFAAKSTFMVEMLETARILNRATPHSLAVLDEVGRGTSASDSLAISFGVIDHLIQVNRSRTLFATHAHELATLLHGRDGVDFFCTELEGAGSGDDSVPDDLACSYALRPGVNTESSGLRVARLAGIPSAALRAALSVASKQ